MTAGKFHINPTTGKVARCGAKIACRFHMSDDEHYDNREEAMKASENIVKENFEGSFSDAGQKRFKLKGYKPLHSISKAKDGTPVFILTDSKTGRSRVVVSQNEEKAILDYGETGDTIQAVSEKDSEKVMKIFF